MPCSSALPCFRFGYVSWKEAGAKCQVALLEFPIGGCHHLPPPKITEPRPLNCFNVRGGLGIGELPPCGEDSHGTGKGVRLDPRVGVSPLNLHGLHCNCYCYAMRWIRTCLGTGTSILTGTVSCTTTYSRGTMQIRAQIMDETASSIFQRTPPETVAFLSEVAVSNLRPQRPTSFCGGYSMAESELRKACCLHPRDPQSHGWCYMSQFARLGCGSSFLRLVHMTGLTVDFDPC